MEILVLQVKVLYQSMSKRKHSLIFINRYRLEKNYLDVFTENVYIGVVHLSQRYKHLS